MVVVGQRQRISIHALREEGDQAPVPGTAFPKDFYPRPPRGGRPVRSGIRRLPQSISIHALREEGDGPFGIIPDDCGFISIHALREEGDSVGQRTAPMLCRFLSTPSVRRATPALPWTTTTVRNFYPRPPRGGRRAQVYPVVLQRDFYPRPPRGGRLSPSCVYALHWKFLSTPSARRATVDGPISVQLVEFLSTPSARRATRSFSASISNWRYFYPRPPRGGRHGQRLHEGAGAQISIHALREEGDLYAPRTKLQHLYFYPRPPRGGRPHNAGDGAVHVLISIHALREEGDAC